jgi:hypothetical protein
MKMNWRRLTCKHAEGKPWSENDGRVEREGFKEVGERKNDKPPRDSIGPKK